MINRIDKILIFANSFLFIVIILFLTLLLTCGIPYLQINQLALHTNKIVDLIKSLPY